MSYVKFEMPEELVPKTLEVVSACKSGKVKKGVNETTKSIERGLSKLVVLAKDVDPPEIVMHIPELCLEKGIAIAYVDSKDALGKAVGLKVPTSCVSVEDSGPAKEALSDLVKRLPKLGEEKNQESKA